MVINALLPAIGTWLIDPAPPQTLWGDHALIQALLPATALPALGMTLLLTLVLRGRVRSGRSGGGVAVRPAADDAAELLLGTLVYGAVLGLALTPAVVLAAWADRVKAPTLPPSSAARSASPVPPR